MRHVGLALALAALAIGVVQADEGASLVDQLFRGPAQPAAALPAADEAHAAAFQELALKRGRSHDHLTGFKRYMDSELLPRSMMAGRGHWEPHVTEMEPSRSGVVPREQPQTANTLEQAIAALKRKSSADTQDEPFRDQVQEGDESEAEVAKKKKEWTMLQEILRLQGLLRAENQKKEQEKEWVKQENLRNEEWAMGEVAHAQIAHVKKQATKRVTKAEAFAQKALAAQRFTAEATAIRTAIDHLRMHKALDAVNLR